MAEGAKHDFCDFFGKKLNMASFWKCMGGAGNLKKF